MKTLKWIGVVVLIGSGSLLSAQSASTDQAPRTALAGAVEHIRVHGKFLEGNLEGDSPDRDVAVYLPPSYAKDQHRRYPVVYFLHGLQQQLQRAVWPTQHSI